MARQQTLDLLIGVRISDPELEDDMPKIEIPPNVLDSIAGEEMKKLRKQNAALEKKVQKLLMDISQNEHNVKRAEFLLNYFREVARDLKDEFELHDYE